MAVKQQLPSRIENLLDVKVAGNDGLPQHICEKCKRRVETLERATEDLGKFRSQASEINGSLVLACLLLRAFSTPLPEDITAALTPLDLKLRAWSITSHTRGDTTKTKLPTLPSSMSNTNGRTS